MKKREIIFDNIKGILIFFVVLGHLLYSYRFYNGEIATRITAYIYFFHMPLFFIVSGYFSQKKINKESIIKLLLLFLIMNISFTIYDFTVTNKFNLFIFKYSSWYILLILIYRLIIESKIIKKMIENKVEILIIISVIISLAGGLINTDLFILRFFENWIYFFIGYCINKKNILNRIKCPNIVLWLFLTFCILIIFVISNVYSTNINFYLGETYTRKLDIIIKYIIIITNILLFIASIKLMSNKQIYFFTRFGRYSLQIYVMHRIIALVFASLFILNKFYIILCFICAFLICYVLSSKPIIKVFDYLIDNVSKMIIKKDVKILILIITIVTVLLTFELKDKKIINIEKRTKNNSEISIGFVGDLILLEEQVKDSKTFYGYSFNYMFKNTKKYIEDTDYMIGVFEGPSDDTKDYSKGNYNDKKVIKLNYPSTFINSIKKSGIDLVTTATNHIYDNGYDSAIRTMDNLESNGLDYVGTYRNNDESSKYKIIEIGGIKLGIVAYTFYTNYLNETNNSEIVSYLTNPEDENFDEKVKMVQNDFKNLKNKGADEIIVLPHYGNEFNFDFSKYQEEWNKIFIENGANIIFGDHTHVIGPIKYEENAVAISSPGNYVNSYNGQDSDLSMFVKVTIDKKTKKVKQTKVIPMIAQKEDKGYYPISLYDLNKKNKNNERVKELLSIFGSVVFNNENVKLKKEYKINKDYKTKEKKLEFTDSDKNSKAYQLIDNSKKVCFIGDSITEGSKNDYKPWYDEMMNHYNKDVENISRIAFTSSDIINEFSEKIEKSNCDLSIINVGTNDIRYYMTSPDQYMKNIKKIIDLIDGKIILLSPWETYSKDKTIGENVLIKKDLYGKYNEKLIKIAKEDSNIEYINPVRYIKSLIYLNGEDTYLLDGVHPNGNEGVKLYSYAVLRGDNY